MLASTVTTELPPVPTRVARTRLVYNAVRKNSKILQDAAEARPTVFKTGYLCTYFTTESGRIYLLKTCQRNRFES